MKQPVKVEPKSTKAVNPIFEWATRREDMLKGNFK